MILPNDMKPLLKGLQQQLRPSEEFGQSRAVTRHIVSDALRLCKSLGATQRFKEIMKSPIQQLTLLSRRCCRQPAGDTSSVSSPHNIIVSPPQCVTVSTPQCVNHGDTAKTRHECPSKDTPKKRAAVVDRDCGYDVRKVFVISDDVDIRKSVRETDLSTVHSTFETVWRATAHFSECLQRRLLEGSEVVVGQPSRQETVCFLAKFSSVLNAIRRAFVDSVEAVHCVGSTPAFSQLAQALNVFFEQLEVQMIESGVFPFAATCLRGAVSAPALLRLKRQLLHNALDQLEQFILTTDQCRTLLTASELSTFQDHCHAMAGVT
ncbi:hypothetical protein NP493_599g00004 [Ridgeia piscesae]|uniref:Uncharacterized protein n=1 Tax=Ridgeia piscesae TaxID=27915 RepID=A0AAD9KTY8_RIDPI|nr:hypothetical protein NP493_599g00004 [Ridgeia piscesae]